MATIGNFVFYPVLIFREGGGGTENGALLVDKGGCVESLKAGKRLGTCRWWIKHIPNVNIINSQKYPPKVNYLQFFLIL